MKWNKIFGKLYTLSHKTVYRFTAKSILFSAWNSYRQLVNPINVLKLRPAAFFAEVVDTH